MKKINSPSIYFLLLTIAALFNSCVIGGNGYSLKGISIPPEVNTFYVEEFDNQTPTAPPTLPQTFRQKLSDRIRDETRLKYDDVNPDIEFQGAISEFRVSAESPQQGQTNAFNRLNISFQVVYVSNLDEEDNWKQRFSHFADFETNQNLVDVQDDLIDEILDEIVERIFNKAFTNW
jgi:hypothetical protein